jgi:two-component system phosphate regulon response regulator PhoB
MAQILILEDNDSIREAVAAYLELADHKVYQAAKIEGTAEMIRKHDPDLLILDVMLPDGNAFNLAKKLKKEKDYPIIFLTARDQESDRITGFELGADDYVVKPFSPKELVLRVNALLRRTGGDAEEISGRKWNHENNIIEIDKEKHLIMENNHPLNLTTAEWKIFEYLSDNAGIVLSREKILARCLEYFYEGSERTVDTHIKNIRSKLKDSNLITTVRGFGYRFEGKEN